MKIRTKSLTKGVMCACIDIMPWQFQLDSSRFSWFCLILQYSNTSEKLAFSLLVCLECINTRKQLVGSDRLYSLTCSVLL